MSRTFALRNQLSAEPDRESDRGCAVLTICVLEECLRRVFSSILPLGKSAAKHFVPRGRLSLAADSAHKLGILNDSLHETFTLLIQIRNTFVHGLSSELTFNSAPIESKVRQLVLPDVSDVPELQAMLKANPRQHFMFAVDNLFFTLEFIANRLEPLKPLALPTFKVSKSHGLLPNK
jgi:hypothetical protein